MKNLVSTILAGALLLPAILAQAHQSEEVAAAVAGGELEKVRGSFKDTWVSPNADFSKYDKIMFGEAEFEFRDVGPAKRYRSSYRHSSSKQEFGVAEADRNKFQGVVSEVFQEEMNRSKRFQVVTSPGPGTLLIEGGVVDIVSHIPPDYVGSSELYISSVGTATLVFEFLDAETGEVLAYAEERRKITPVGGGRIDEFSMPSNSVTQWNDIKRWARSSASRLRKELEKAQKGK